MREAGTCCVALLRRRGGGSGRGATSTVRRHHRVVTYHRVCLSREIIVESGSHSSRRIHRVVESLRVESLRPGVAGVASQPTSLQCSRPVG